MAKPDLDALIISNLADLDVVVQRLYFEIQPNIGEKIDEMFEHFKDRENWKGKGNFDDDWRMERDLPWLAPPNWRMSDGDDDDYSFYFFLEPGQKDRRGKSLGEDTFWLTRLLGLGTGTLGLRWQQEEYHKNKWKSFMMTQAKLIIDIRERGFTYEEGEGLFFLPIKLEISNLIAAVLEDDLDPAMSPLQSALDCLQNSRPLFDALIKNSESIG